MKKKVVQIMVLICTPFSSLTSAEDGVLFCVDKLGTGVDKVERGYEVFQFNPLRFTVKLNGTSSMEMSETDGLVGGRFICSRGKDTQETYPIKCRHSLDYVMSTFTIDPSSGRYVRTQVGSYGYVTNQTDSDVLYVGKCQRF